MNQVQDNNDKSKSNTNNQDKENNPINNSSNIPANIAAKNPVSEIDKAKTEINMNNVMNNSAYNNNMNNMYMNNINNTMFPNGMGMMNNYYNYMNPSMYINMYPMGGMMNNNINSEDQNINRIKYLLGNIQQNLFYIMNNITEIAQILNSMKNEGSNNNPNYYSLKNQFNQMLNNMNNMNFMNMNINNNMNQNNNVDKKNQINIKFYKTGKGISGAEKTTIICNKKDKVEDLIEKYRIKIMDRNPKLKFIYNARAIDSRPEATLEEVGLYNDSTIVVITVKI